MVRSLGIDIGTSSIKVVEVSGTSRHTQILSYREYPIGANPGYDTQIEVLEILRSLALEQGSGQTRIVYGLRQDFISARFRTFPFADRSKILKSLPFELEEDLPYSADTAIYDARISQLIGATAEVIAVAAPKNRIEDTLKRLSDSGLPASILTAEALALSNCFERWQDPPPTGTAPTPRLNEESIPQNLTARVHIGHTHSLVLAYAGHRVVGARSILWGAKQVIDAISRRYEIPYIEAEKEMKTKAFILLTKAGASYDQILFSDTISQQVKDLGRELKISMIEFEGELNGHFTGVDITGPFSQVLNLNAFLTQSLEVPVNRGQFLSNFNGHFERTPAIEATIGVALGLALEGLRKPRNPAIQFLRQEFAKQNEGFKEFWNNWGASIKYTAIALVLFFIFTNLRDQFSGELLERASEALKKQAKEVAGLNARSANEAGVKSYIRKEKQRAAEARALEAVLGMNSAADIVKKISDAIPSRPNVQLKINRLHVEDDRVVLSGVVKQTGMIQLIESALRGVARSNFKTQMGAALPGQAGVQFTINFEVDRNLTAKQ